MPYRNVMGAIVAAMVLSLAPGDRLNAQDLSKYPDWSGQWKMTVSPTSQVAFGVNWDPDKGSGLAQQAPLTPEYQARYEANLKDQAAGGQGDERHSYCIPLGMPRLMTVVYPMEIVIMPKTTYVLTDNSEPRRIFTDEREWPAEIEPSFNGLSIGKWIDADAGGHYSTLEVETRGLKGPRTFDASGIRMHDDNETIVKEHIHLDPANRNILIDEITTIDHALTRPWTVTKKYLRDPNPRPIWRYNECAENNPLILVGKESYYLSQDGFLMPVKQGQPPPDLRYFKPAKK
jgi:hypothetical protein